MAKALLLAHLACCPEPACCKCAWAAGCCKTTWDACPRFVRLRFAIARPVPPRARNRRGLARPAARSACFPGKHPRRSPVPPGSGLAAGRSRSACCERKWTGAANTMRVAAPCGELPEACVAKLPARCTRHTAHASERRKWPLLGDAATTPAAATAKSQMWRHQLPNNRFRSVSHLVD
eukprot:366227-Chlamydomonas_euryale.AAC.16